MSGAPDTTIVHLSDLHLGKDIFWRRLLHWRRWWKTEDPQLLEQLSRAIRDVAPDFVVVSGDLVNTCAPDEFDHAAERLSELLLRAGIDIPKKVFIVPGNHDVEVFPTEDEYFGRVKEFVRFLKLFFKEGDYRSRKERFSFVDRTARLCLFGLDSTLHDQQPIAEGQLGTTQLQWLEQKHAKLQRLHPDLDQFVKVVVLHHHPHPIAAGGKDRFMQLLDAGDAIATFERIGVNVVLHGHKHFPHTLKHTHAASHSHYIVIGAGTACCPFPEEQAGAGNSFNVISIKPGANMLEISRVKADNNKVFVPGPTRDRFPLFEPSPRGYRMREHHLVGVVRDLDGTLDLTDRRVGLIADDAPTPDHSVRQIRFGVDGLPDGATITQFSCSEQEVERIEYVENKATVRKGAFVLRRPLTWGSSPIDLEYRCTIAKGVRMGKGTAEADPAYEEFQLTIVHPCAEAVLALQFPPTFVITPQAQVLDPNYAGSGDLAHELLYDDSANRHSLRIKAPKLGYQYRIRWKLAAGAGT